MNFTDSRCNLVADGRNINQRPKLRLVNHSSQFVHLSTIAEIILENSSVEDFKVSNSDSSLRILMSRIGSPELNALSSLSAFEISFEDSQLMCDIQLGENVSNLSIIGSEFFGRFNASMAGLSWLNICGGTSKTVFREVANFSRTREEKQSLDFLQINDTQFQKDADFRNRKFGGRTNFDQSEFQTQLIAHGAEFHQDTSFRGTKFTWGDYVLKRQGLFKSARILRQNHPEILNEWGEALKAKLWPRYDAFLPFTKKICNWRIDASKWFYSVRFPLLHPEKFARTSTIVSMNDQLGQIERSFRTLRQAMDGHNAADQAAKFHLHEMRARHKRIGDGSVARSEKWVGLIYDTLSDYGASFVKPLWQRPSP